MPSESLGVGRTYLILLGHVLRIISRIEWDQDVFG